MFSIKKFIPNRKYYTNNNYAQTFIQNTYYCNNNCNNNKTKLKNYQIQVYQAWARNRQQLISIKRSSPSNEINNSTDK
jgi:hypothetical protein